ncbi:AraC family transcriptional regulator [Vibrio brasiliensis]|jgi:AraC-like DNA-binding protein|uniref:AraC-type DNA-binding domain-containing protein n=1 Tax=Vibrio brasiliensis LMG 20546 TaxID=945543 RepID=E8LRL7_9VIBR|nr:AraC family transcriptional regulator [Vibrio brasiliensis]EGA66620.1 AraC-type DNA-binding domain-containing protein [Vibrio brasiliensis LMG 20546]MCG9649242.1 AraC family transcriptional regulator [Vibrio brasiliensis]MCG9725240.1 AraC family transcriptional regulator [Vibrio brasiliensis]MCG9752876.1 AraC family transcriptional regulator [Vibrio brasiliensis]MCG9782735.1 AraC family transcriptional regulator [Vibrio brasiliensis]
MAKSAKESASFHLAGELGGLELLDAKYTNQNFSRHSHEGYTIGVIEKGAQRFYRTGGNHIAPQDSIILVNADEVHNGQTATEGGWEYKAMYPLPEQFEQLSQGLSSRIATPYFTEPVVYDPEMAQQLRLVFNTLAQSDNKLLRETLVYGTLVKLVSRHSKTRVDWEPKTRSQRQLVLVKEFLDDFPQADVSLEDLSKLAGLSPYYLTRSFQKEFGLPPHAYQIQARLRVAKQLLRQGMRISDVAQETGFHDQSHFHRHFKRALGVTPKQFVGNN